MKSFIRRSLALGSVLLGTLGVGIVGAGFVANSAMALTQEQVGSKLVALPAYIMVSGESPLLVSTSPDAGTEQSILYVFMTEGEADLFLANARENNPDFAADARIEQANLQALYQESRNNTEQPLRLVFVPEREEAEQAAAISEDYQRGVPLFAATFEDGSLVPVSQENGETVVPMFFSRADLESSLEQIAAVNPEAREAINIGVYPLERLIAEMESSDDAQLDQIRLFPDSETVNSIIQSRGQ